MVVLWNHCVFIFPLVSFIRVSSVCGSVPTAHIYYPLSSWFRNRFSNHVMRERTALCLVKCLTKLLLTELLCFFSHNIKFWNCQEIYVVLVWKFFLDMFSVIDNHELRVLFCLLTVSLEGAIQTQKLYDVL